MAFTGAGTADSPIIIDDFDGDSGNNSGLEYATPAVSGVTELPAWHLFEAPATNPSISRHLTSSEGDSAIQGVGYSILLRMGFQPGKGLGKHLEGFAEPISATGHTHNQPHGLGHRPPMQPAEKGNSKNASTKAVKGKPVKARKSTKTTKTPSAVASAAHRPLTVKAAPQTRPDPSVDLTRTAILPRGKVLEVPLYGEQFPISQDNSLPPNGDFDFRQQIPHFPGTWPAGGHRFCNLPLPSIGPSIGFYHNQSAFTNFVHNIHSIPPSHLFDLPFAYSPFTPGAAMSPFDDYYTSSGSTQPSPPSAPPSKLKPSTRITINGIQYRSESIGKMPNAKHERRGAFTSLLGPPLVPERALVLEDLPRKHRSEDFIKRWLGQFENMDSVSRIELQNDKVLVEFADRHSRDRAFHSRRMHSDDGLAGVRAWPYRVQSEEEVQSTRPRLRPPRTVGPELPLESTQPHGQHEPSPLTTATLTAMPKTKALSLVASVPDDENVQEARADFLLDNLLTLTETRLAASTKISSPVRTSLPTHSIASAGILSQSMGPRTPPPQGAWLSSNVEGDTPSAGLDVSPRGVKRSNEEAFTSDAEPYTGISLAAAAEDFIAGAIREAKRAKVEATVTLPEVSAIDEHLLQELFAKFRVLCSMHSKSSNAAIQQRLFERIVEVFDELMELRPLLTSCLLSFTSKPRPSPTSPRKPPPRGSTTCFLWSAEEIEQQLIIEIDDDDNDEDS